MSYLDKLLNGVDVEWTPLGEASEIKRGRRLIKSQLEEGGEYAVFQNCMIPLGYYHNSNVKADTAFIISAGSAGEIGYSNVDFWAADDVYYFITPKNLESKYLYYFILTQQQKIIGQVRRSSVPRLSRSVFEKIQIPIPPLSVQKEIVRILDTFTELTTELTARKKQYNYYRDQLLSFEADEVEWKPLGEVLGINRGRRLIKSQLEETGKYAVFQNCMIPLGYYHESNVNSDTTFIISAGSAGEIGYSSVDFWAADDVYYFTTPENFKSKFLYYFLLTQQQKIAGQVRRSSVPRLSKTAFEKMPIPIPSIKEQERIVAILDKFCTLAASISEGLPKEIELRQKQYEYYRDMLLTFPKN